MKAIDTCVLIWGIRGHLQEGREDLVERCRTLIEIYKRRHEAIMVPSVVLAEYLCGFSLDLQKIQRAYLESNFFVAPFDAAAAAIAAEIYDRLVMDERRLAGTGRQCLKADLEIIATSIAHGASHIYTDNFDDFNALGKGRIIVERIPENEPDRTEPTPPRAGNLELFPDDSGDGS